MRSWISNGISGRGIKSVLRLYLFGLCFAAPLALLTGLLFDTETAFNVTPLFILAAVIIVLLVYWGEKNYAVAQTVVSPTPWLQLQADPPRSEEEATSPEARAAELINLGAEKGDKFGAWNEALALYNEAIRINSMVPEAWSNKGVAHWNLGEHSAAIGCLDRAIEVDSGVAEIWFNKALAAWRFRRLDKAMACFNRALQLKPQLLDSWLSRNTILEEVFSKYEETLMRNSTPAEGWFLKGKFLLSVNRYREALECFEVASELGNRQADQEVNSIRRLLAEVS